MGRPVFMLNGNAPLARGRHHILPESNHLGRTPMSSPMSRPHSMHVILSRRAAPDEDEHAICLQNIRVIPSRRAASKHKADCNREQNMRVIPSRRAAEGHRTCHDTNCCRLWSYLDHCIIPDAQKGGARKGSPSQWLRRMCAYAAPESKPDFTAFSYSSSLIGDWASTPADSWE